MDNKTLSRILRETAELLQIDGAMIGRYRSYEKTAEMIAGMHESIEEIAKDTAKLTELPGVGDRMAEHIQEILKTGDYSLRQKLLKKFPASLLEVMTLQSLGPKKVAFLWANFKAVSYTHLKDSSSAPWARPTACAAIPMRPPSRALSAIFRPWPSWPRRFSAATSQASRIISTLGEHRWPIFSS